VVFFGRVGYTYTFEHAGLDRGNQIAFLGGTGFSLNDRVSLNMQVKGIYDTENTKLNGRTITGSSQESVSLQLGGHRASDQARVRGTTRELRAHERCSRCCIRVQCRRDQVTVLGGSKSGAETEGRATDAGVELSDVWAAPPDARDGDRAGRGGL
jgi:hypothetical protein